MTTRSLDWAVGIFEGEGCFVASKREGRNWMFGMNILMTDEDVVQAFAETVGFGSVGLIFPTRSQKAGHKPSYRWQVFGKRAEQLAWQFYPLLGQRRRARFAELLSEVKEHNRNR